jgi:hypothetical protein
MKTYGIGLAGLKVRDYQEQSRLLQDCGFGLIDGYVILSGMFFSILSLSGLSEDDEPDDLKKTKCPPELVLINRSILSELKIGVPYAVRSSALSERGGTGIYHTDFFVPKGDTDIDEKCLWEKERLVYASELSSAAKAWRRKTRGEVGLAIWITKVHGIKFDGYFLPALSGVAYTSYQGLPTVRVVVGLGTKAVAGEGLIYNQPPENGYYFSRNLWDQRKADAISLVSGLVESIFHDQKDFPSLGLEPFESLFAKLAELKKSGDFYLEWALTKEGVKVVQCAPYQDKLPEKIVVDAAKYFLLAEGHDVFNSGRADCQGVVYVRKWSPTSARFLKMLNDSMSGYLLIITQDAFSAIGGINIGAGIYEHVSLGFEHFSNASAVIEKQVYISEQNRFDLSELGIIPADHTRDGGKGATHFQQLCSRTDILFVGAEFDMNPLLNLPGKIDQCEDEIVSWDMEAKVSVNADAQEKKGFVYVAKQAKEVAYSPEQVIKLSFEIRDRDNQLCDQGKEESEYFYNVSYAIGAHRGMNPVDFNPFKMDQSIIDECGLDGFISAVEFVLKDAKELGQDNVVKYLSQLLEKIKAQ